MFYYRRDEKLNNYFFDSKKFKTESLVKKNYVEISFSGETKLNVRNLTEEFQIFSHALWVYELINSENFISHVPLLEFYFLLPKLISLNVN